MPWRPESLMSQRLEFVEAVLHRAPGQSIRDICRRVGISERVGHKWLARFGAGGPAALADRSHAARRGAGAPGALGGLSTLAVWWIRLGIRPERIERGAPQQNGAHERMHRTLKAETTRPPSATVGAQHQRFERWRRTFNERRPHEALANTPPSDHYTRSARPLPPRLPLLEYPADVELRRVTSSGTINWRTTRFFLSTTLAGEYVSLRETADAEWTIAFGPLTLGVYSASALAFHEALAWTPGTA